MMNFEVIKPYLLGVIFLVVLYLFIREVHPIKEGLEDTKKTTDNPTQYAIIDSEAVDILQDLNSTNPEIKVAKINGIVPEGIETIKLPVFQWASSVNKTMVGQDQLSYGSRESKENNTGGTLKTYANAAILQKVGDFVNGYVDIGQITYPWKSFDGDAIEFIIQLPDSSTFTPKYKTTYLHRASVKEAPGKAGGGNYPYPGGNDVEYIIYETSTALDVYKWNSATSQTHKIRQLVLLTITYDTSKKVLHIHYRPAYNSTNKNWDDGIVGPNTSIPTIGSMNNHQMYGNETVNMNGVVLKPSPISFSYITA